MKREFKKMFTEINKLEKRKRHVLENTTIEYAQTLNSFIASGLEKIDEKINQKIIKRRAMLSLNFKDK